MWFMYVYKLKAFQTTPNWILFRLTFIIVFFISIRAFFVYTLNARRYSEFSPVCWGLGREFA